MVHYWHQACSEGLNSSSRLWGHTCFGCGCTISVSQSTRRPHTIDFCAQNNHLKYTTPAVRQKQQALEDEPCPFEVKPSKGILGAGKWWNLQIRFTPKEERSYRNELELNICGSSSHLKLHLSGQGLEPRLEFNPPALKMGWVLVDSDGVEATAVVRNPCDFPIEFCSLDFDEQYLEEKKHITGLSRSVLSPW
ncbi:hydrocephalus-inducing protein-like [Lonchura striata]